MAFRCVQYLRQERRAASRERVEFYQLLAGALGMEIEYESHRLAGPQTNFAINALAMGMTPNRVQVSPEEIAARERDDPWWDRERGCWIWQ